MNRKSLLLVSCLCLLLIAGNIHGQQYIPKELKNMHSDSLATLILDFIPNKCKIDNKNVKKTRIYLRQGKHILQYRIRQETEEWKEFEKAMNEDGFYWNERDLNFIRPSDGSIAEVSPFFFRFKRFPISKEINIKKGNIYNLSFNLGNVRILTKKDNH